MTKIYETREYSKSFILILNILCERNFILAPIRYLLNIPQPLIDKQEVLSIFCQELNFTKDEWEIIKPSLVIIEQLKSYKVISDIDTTNPLTMLIDSIEGKVISIEVNPF